MDLILVLDNVRSAHNVGSLLRTADGLGVKTVYTAGLTPHPRQTGDQRLPHVITTAEGKLAKTALGAEKTLDVIHYPDMAEAIKALRTAEHFVIGLEQTPGAADLAGWSPPNQPLALIVGHEIDGLSPEALAAVDQVVMIPMRGHKESFNVAAAGAMAMYALSVPR